MAVELSLGGFTNGKLSVALIGESRPIEAFDLTLSFSSGQVVLESPFEVTFPTGWTGLVNSDGPRKLLVSAFTLNETPLLPGAPGMALSLPLQNPLDTHVAVTLSAIVRVAVDETTERETVPPTLISLGDSTAALVNRQIEAYVWRDQWRLDDVLISLDDQRAEATLGGRLTVQTDRDASLSLLAERNVTPSELGAINLQDAIAILKMIVGLPVNGAGKPLSPYQSLAADFDGNGSVTLTDAIGVLKHVVGLPAPAPRWMFADEADVTMPLRAGLSPEKSTTQGGLGPVSLDDLEPYAGRVALVGVLRGDVDGSWRAPSGTAALTADPSSYFESLSTRLNDLSDTASFNPSQWGVYAG